MASLRRRLARHLPNFVVGAASDMRGASADQTFTLPPSSHVPKLVFGQVVIDNQGATFFAKASNVRVRPLQEFKHLGSGIIRRGVRAEESDLFFRFLKLPERPRSARTWAGV
jgi:hypothetical protein